MQTKVEPGAAVAKLLPVESSESVNRLIAPSTREEQLSYVVREALARQAQHDSQVALSQEHSKVDASLASSSSDYIHSLALPSIYQSGARQLSLADDIESHLGKLSESASAVSQKLFFERTQERAFDRIADSLFPGFGRLEFSILKRDLRFDYLNGRKCGAQKFGLCVSTTGK
jgi:hypothetical protein